MSVYITNAEKFDISIREKTLKPGSGDVFSDEIATQEGVVAFIKKGWLKCEMVKESPDAVSVEVVKPEPVKVAEPAPQPRIEHGKKKKVVHTEPAR